jgi:hypothetical protein
VPTGVAVFPREIAPPIRRFAESSDTIVHWTEFGRGGYFGLAEVVEGQVQMPDLRGFLRPSDHVRITRCDVGSDGGHQPQGRFFPRCSPQISLQITFRGCRLIV